MPLEFAAVMSMTTKVVSLRPLDATTFGTFHGRKTEKRLPAGYPPIKKHLAPVAQWIEHSFPKAGVAGSIPARGAFLGIYSDYATCPARHGVVLLL